MKLSISVLVLLSVIVLATPSEAGWVSEVVQKAANATEQFIKNPSNIKRLVDIVSKYGPMVVAAARGKRSVGGSCAPQADPQGRALLAELELQCPLLFGKGRSMGLTSNDLLSAFQATDGNKDKELNDNELGLFENTLEALQHCLEILRKPKGN